MLKNSSVHLVKVQNDMAEVFLPKRMAGIKPAAGNCAHTSHRPEGKDFKPMMPGTNHITSKTTHKRSEKIHRVDIIFRCAP